jgi:predicted dehydrogenase
MEPGLDWDMWHGPAPKRPYHSELSPRGVHKHFPHWRRYREFGGGMVTDWGAHHFDIAQWGLGMDDSGPVEILPASNPKATEGVRLKYANGVEVLHKNNGFGVSFLGEKGKVLVNRGRFELSLGDNPSKPADSAAKKNDAMQSAAQAEKQYLADAKVKLYNSNDHKADWLTAIKERQKPICDVEIGARTVTVCHLVNLAYYHGQSMKWDPAKNHFVGNTGNKDWLDVPHRRPWTV